MKTDYHAKYFAHELTRKYSADTIEKFVGTLSEAQVQLNPHQIDAALFAFNSPFSKGAVLADEVGLGKTIEAGIVISQYWAERKRKILIIMPASLRKQWQQELLEKFFLKSIILETKSFNEEIRKGNFNPFENDQIVICSYNFASSKSSYIRKTSWDLVVIDEAHRLRNVYKSSNKISNNIKNSILDKNKILLTATPLQNSLLELYGLVGIIDDHIFGDVKSFKEQYGKVNKEVNFKELKERISPICQRTLRKQVLEYIKYTNRIAITEEFFPTEKEHELYEGISSYLQRDRLYALPESQRNLMTLILRKLLASSTYAISKTLGGLAQKLQRVIFFHKNGKDKDKDELEKELSENIENYEEIREEWIDEEDDGNDSQSEDSVKEKEYTDDEISEMKEEYNLLLYFYKLASEIKENSKGNKLLTALERGFVENAKNGGNKKALIFTESRRTQEYLSEILENTQYKGKIILFNGSNNDVKSKKIYQEWLKKYEGTDKISNSNTANKKAALVEYFRDNAEIMIATEAAAEGINLQFCSIVVNYDLPWNPQRIEQRIGRCHRYGQKHDVVVVNFLNKKNAADRRVYELLKEKFMLFSGVFGTSDEILGTTGAGLDFEKRIIQIVQSCRTEDEINKQFDDLQKEMECKIDEEMLLTRRKLLENFDEEVAEKLQISKNFTEKFLNKFNEQLWNITKIYLNGYAKFDEVQKSFILEKNPFQDICVNFGLYKFCQDGECANTYRIGHPLAEKIIENYKNKKLDIKELVFNYSNNKSKKISILESLIGKSGWMILKNITIQAFEEENYLFFAGYDDKDNIIDEEQCKKMFSLDAELQNLVKNNVNIEKLNEKIEEQKQEKLIYISDRNSNFFDKEMSKLESWAEDKKASLEIALKQIDKDIKTRKTESRKILKLEDKLVEQKAIKEMELKRNKMRKELFDSQDLVDQQKDDLIRKIEANLKQNIKEEDLFLIRWRVV